MTEVGVRRSSLSTMAFTSVLLFIFSIYSCYAQVPLLMWTSNGYVTRLFFWNIAFTFLNSTPEEHCCGFLICVQAAESTFTSDLVDCR